ncbi:MAG: MerR family transcriptional regulator [Deltaproteobacteria bacterium]|nr:MerR family transcriptional regulator [Deltaproteobacteria bacterium]
MDQVEIPNKKYFKIGETSSLLGVKPHVLRYWESEFPQIRPFKSKTGQRLYKRSDLEALARIQKLLYKERFTIAGAKKALKMPDITPTQERLLSIKKELESILELLR